MKKIFVVIDKLISDENSWELHVSSLLHGYAEASDSDYMIE